jgi:hypothetical protein
MQRQSAFHSSLVLVIQGLSLIFVLCAVGRGGRRVMSMDAALDVDFPQRDGADRTRILMAAMAAS